MRADLKVWAIEDITDGDFVRVLYQGTSIDDTGELPSFSDSELAEHFSGKILNADRLGKIKKERGIRQSFRLDYFKIFYLFKKSQAYE